MRNPRFQGVELAAQPRPAARPIWSSPRSWGVKPSTLAIAWTLAKAPHVVPIPGTRSADHLEECAAAADFELDAAQLAELERVLPVGFAAGERYSDAAVGRHPEILRPQRGARHRRLFAATALEQRTDARRGGRAAAAPSISVDR